MFRNIDTFFFFSNVFSHFMFSSVRTSKLPPFQFKNFFFVETDWCYFAISKI